MTVTERTWDSGFFGFPVGEVVGPDLDDAGLAAALGAAAARGFRLVYWAAAPDREAGPDLLRAFAGTLVDRKVTFVGDMDAVLASPAQAVADALVISEHPAGPACERLLALGVATGVHSRFSVDPRIPRADYERLYRTWMDRSSRRESSDVVLVARQHEADPDFVGFIALSGRDGEGRGDLMAVPPHLRRNGIGGSLVRAMHRWQAARGVRRVFQTTQRANVNSCNQWRRFGYAEGEERNFYHFWPHAAAAAA